MELLSRTILLGLAIGGIYALLAIGLALLFGVMRVVNFAHGAMFMLGAFGAYYATRAGMPPIVGVAAAVAVGGILGYLTDVTLMRPVRRGRVDLSEEYVLIVTFALMLVLTAGSSAVFGDSFRSMDGFWSANISIGDWVRLSGDRVVAFCVAGALIALLYWIVYRTDIGRGWRALTQSSVGAEIIGMNIGQLANRAFVASAALAGAAGALIAPLYLVYPGIAQLALMKGFAVVVIGGLGSMGGCLVAGLLLGVVEAIGATYFSSAYRDVYGFGLMILILMVRPRGLFGREVRSL